MWVPPVQAMIEPLHEGVGRVAVVTPTGAMTECVGWRCRPSAHWVIAGCLNNRQGRASPPAVGPVSAEGGCAIRGRISGKRTLQPTSWRLWSSRLLPRDWRRTSLETDFLVLAVFDDAEAEVEGALKVDVPVLSDWVRGIDEERAGCLGRTKT